MGGFSVFWCLRFCCCLFLVVLLLIFVLALLFAFRWWTLLFIGLSLMRDWLRSCIRWGRDGLIRWLSCIPLLIIRRRSWVCAPLKSIWTKTGSWSDARPCSFIKEALMDGLKLALAAMLFEIKCYQKLDCFHEIRQISDAYIMLSH